MPFPHPKQENAVDPETGDFRQPRAASINKASAE